MMYKRVENMKILKNVRGRVIYFYFLNYYLVEFYILLLIICYVLFLNGLFEFL